MKVPKYVAATVHINGVQKFPVLELGEWDTVHKPIAWAENAHAAKRLAQMASEGEAAREARLRKRRAAEKRRARAQ
jgi:hypothetical protein